MELEWDENKRSVNLATYGIDFEDAIAIWDGSESIVPSAQNHRGEERFLAIGECKGRIFTVVFTWRGNRIRLISARRARRK